MDKDIITALRWAGGYLLGTVLFTILVGVYVLATRLYS